MRIKRTHLTHEERCIIFGLKASNLSRMEWSELESRHAIHSAEGLKKRLQGGMVAPNTTSKAVLPNIRHKNSKKSERDESLSR